MSQYILFYSKKDQKSMHFMNLLHKIGIRQNFTCFDVSPVKGPKPTKYIRQFQITHIPTICVDDQYYIGNNALIWLKSVISDMGLRGPQSMSSRQNKECFDKALNDPFSFAKGLSKDYTLWTIFNLDPET